MEELVEKYISGEEIDNIDELENDIVFMEKVFIKTKDSKMYSFCSKELKGNKDFILFLINLFRSDKEFIKVIVNNYLQINDIDSIITELYHEKWEDIIEVSLFTIKILNKQDKEFIFSLQLILSLIYSKGRKEYENYKDTIYCKPGHKKIIQMGFLLFYDM